MTRQRILRGTAAILAAAELVLGVGFAGLFLASSSDPLGPAIAAGVAELTAVPLVLCALPALILAWRDRWMPLALVLALATPALWLLLLAKA